MTREERNNAIKVLKNFDLNNSKVNSLLFSAEEITNAFDMAIEALEQQPCEDARWVPVSEEYPTKNGRYLVTVKQGYITFGAWVDVAENWVQVTAWMPLPEPYKAESEE